MQGEKLSLLDRRSSTGDSQALPERLARRWRLRPGRAVLRPTPLRKNVASSLINEESQTQASGPRFTDVAEGVPLRLVDVVAGPVPEDAHTVVDRAPHAVARTFIDVIARGVVKPADAVVVRA